MRRVSRLAVGFLLVALAGCASPATTPTPSDGGTSPSASVDGEAGHLPPGCELIDLRDPTGARIVLDGRWTEVSTPDTGDLMTWWIWTHGTCVWGAGQVDDVRTGDPFSWSNQVQSLTGRISSDFTITGELVWLGPLPPLGGESGAYAPLRMLIEFNDAGQVLLRDDREAGVPGPHCPSPQGFCPEPLVLERAD
jgi:hypothetical protein